MSRLVDRIMAGCQTFRASLMYSHDEYLDEFRAKALEDLGGTREEEKIEALARKRLAAFLAFEPVAKRFDLNQLAGLPIIAGDDVAAYVGSLPGGSKMSDLVASMAPPFDRFFVEFQGVSFPFWSDTLNGWGALVVALDDPSKIHYSEGDDGPPRWILTLHTFLEREKGKPFGPVAEHLLGLAEDGTWFRHSDGALFWAGGTPAMDDELPPEVIKQHGDRVANLLFPVLLTISFMHCKNVSLQPISPPPKLSHSYRKKHGRNLLRYHVLEIGPIRRLLDQHRRGGPDDLRRALHICRGHFKTFTPDAPLLGHHTGT